MRTRALDHKPLSVGSLELCGDRIVGLAHSRLGCFSSPDIVDSFLEFSWEDDGSGNHF